MSVSLSPIFQLDSAQVDANGDPRSGALLFTYLAGTSTKVTVYKTSAGSGGASHENPIELDANGLPPAPIWLTQGLTYKFYLAAAGDTDPPTSPLIPVSDNITGINDVADAVVNEWVSGTTPTFISSVSFSVVGDQTSLLHVNRRLKLTVTGVAQYAYIIKSVYTSLTTVTVLVDGGASLSGLTAMSYGIVSGSQNTSLPFLSYDQQCCRLGYVSATSIRLDPQDGKMIWVYTGASGWTRRSVSSSGVTAANTNTYVDGVAGQTLSTIGATYYVYLFDNSGTLTLDFSTTAPAVDATSGLKIKTGDATRLLVGMARVQNGSSQFVTPGLVLSWYKRRGITVTGAALTGPPTTSSTSTVELQAAAQVKFLSWAEEAISTDFVGRALSNTLDASYATGIYLDGVVTQIALIVSVLARAGNVTNVSFGAPYTVTEGYHYVTIGVSVSAGPTIGQWDAGTLHVLTQG
jgi:hypothetical protein